MASTAPRKTTTRKTAVRKTTARKPASAARNGAKSKTTARKAVAGSVGAQTTATRYDQAIGAAKTAIDLPVGVALTVRDQLTERFGELIGPFTARESAERELRTYRAQLTRRLNKAERRGATTRTKATRSVKRTQTQVERELRRRRRQAETSLRQNRRRFEREGRRIQADLGQAVQTRTTRVQELGANVVAQVTSLV